MPTCFIIRLCPGWDNSQPLVSLNPSTLSPDSDLDCLLHQCDKVVAQVNSTSPDIRNSPLSETEQTWYMDRGSFIHKGQRRAEAVLTTEMEVIWTQSLPPGTSTQMAKLITLTQALIMRRELVVKIFRESKIDIYNCSHAWSCLLLTAEGRTVKK